MRTERLNDPDPTTWYPSDDDEQTHKCAECGDTVSEDEVCNGVAWFPSRGKWVSICPPCLAEFQRLDSELDWEEEKRIDKSTL